MVYYISENSIFQIRVTEPKARKDLQKLATHLRKRMGIKDNQLYVDVLSILEFILPKKDETFEFVVPDRWFTNEIRPAFYNPEENRIYIRADIYDKLLEGDNLKVASEQIYYDSALTRTLKIAMYTNNFTGLLSEYVNVSQNKIKIAMKRLTLIIQLSSYVVIGLIIVFIYQILFLPMQAISMF